MPLYKQTISVLQTASQLITVCVRAVLIIYIQFIALTSRSNAMTQIEQKALVNSIEDLITGSGDNNNPIFWHCKTVSSVY